MEKKERKKSKKNENIQNTYGDERKSLKSTIGGAFDL